MLGAPKFDAPKRYKYAKERQEAYGGDDALPERAKLEWPDFTKAIEIADELMGGVLFANLNYSKYVDRENIYASPEERDDFITKNKMTDDQVKISGIIKYLPTILSLKLPRGFNPFYTVLDTIESQAHNLSLIHI